MMDLKTRFRDISRDVYNSAMSFAQLLTFPNTAERDRDSATVTEEREDLVHYEGCLGTFDYNPNDFELCDFELGLRDESERPLTITCLKYIGDEVDGKKIRIPDGITDISLMFDGCESLTSVPDIPSSVERSFATFRDCTGLTDISIMDFGGSKLKDMQFMFSGCKNLVHSLAFLPPKVEQTDYMFFQCDSMVDSPRMCRSVKSADGMYAMCRSLDSVPDMPFGIRKQATDFVVGCDNIVGKISDEQKEKMDAKREKALSKQEKMGVFQRATGVFGFVFRTIAIQRSMSHTNIFKSMQLARENGVNDPQANTFANGLYELCSTFHGDFSDTLTDKLGTVVQKQRDKYDKKISGKRDLIERSYDFGSGLSSDKNAILKARSDFNVRHEKRGNIFDQLSDASERTLLSLKRRYAGVPEKHEALYEKFKDAPLFKHRAQKTLSSYYIRELSASVSYYKEVGDLISKDDVNGEDALEVQEKRLDSLNTIVGWEVSDVIKSVVKMEDKYHIFSKEDLIRLDELYSSLPVSVQEGLQSDIPGFTGFGQRYGLTRDFVDSSDIVHGRYRRSVLVSEKRLFDDQVAYGENADLSDESDSDEFGGTVFDDVDDSLAFSENDVDVTRRLPFDGLFGDDGLSRGSDVDHDDLVYDD